MKKPTLGDYDLSPEKLSRVQLIEGRISLWCGAAVFLLYIGAVLFVLTSQANIGIGEIVALFLLYIMLGSFIPFVILLLIIALSCILLRLTWPEWSAVGKYKDALEKYTAWWKRTQTDFWFSLSGLAFERELANLYSRCGFQVELTPASNDKGVDIWLQLGDERVVVQCKAFKKPVGPAVVRELYGTLQHFHADRAILASLAGFTTGVRQYVIDKPIELVDVSDILRMQSNLDS